MAILSAMQSAAIRLLGQKPNTFFGAQGAFELEIADLVNEVARDIVKYQDWQALIYFAPINGDGSTAIFPLPEDYDRMLTDSRVQDTSNWFWGYRRLLDVNIAARVDAGAWVGYPGGWMILRNELRFFPAPATGSTALYPYISRYYAKDAGTQQVKGEFNADSDEFVLPERLLTLGLIWRWREQKKLDGTGDQEAFVKALDEYAAKDKGARVYRSNSRGHIPGVGVAWPWELG
ncbi:MAG: hypothetical protein EON59_05410 [Alphaproteobacteria bacterium]|nr:MAG: hypothetical protein EON59_05410 [Alphaproteobacteria bacterium]